MRPSHWLSAVALGAALALGSGPSWSKTLPAARKAPSAERLKGKRPAAQPARPKNAVRAPIPSKGAQKPLSSYGSISVGHPDVGFLINGVALPRSPSWVATAPTHAWGTAEAIAQLSHCVNKVRTSFASSPPVMIGSISRQGGGAAPPHKSHRTGRDADVYFFRKPEAKWFEAATQSDLDLPRTWALLRCFVSEADVDFVLIDRRAQGWLESYALASGEPRAWVQSLFRDGPGYQRAVVRHAPGHVAHMHVRFVSAASRQRASALYEQLVSEGRLKPPYAALKHRVGRGDTLGGIAKKYKTTAQRIQAQNRLRSNVIHVGQELVISRPAVLRGVKEPIITPPRRRPPKPEALSDSPSGATAPYADSG